MTPLDLVTSGIIGLIGLVMIVAGVLKLLGVESQVEEFHEFGYPQWFRGIVGGLELLGGAGLLAGLLVGSQVLVLGSAALVAVVLAGALGTHLHVGDPIAELAPAGILLVLCVAAVAAYTQLLV